MKHSKKKRGFTLVELVIVIAVIAILAAVLIPTFANLIRLAKRSADEQTVSGMNLALEAEEIADQKKPDGAQSAFNILIDAGFNVPTEPSSSGYQYYWITEDNRVVLVEMDGEKPKTIVYPEALKIKYSDKLPTDWYTLKADTKECTHDDVSKYKFAPIVSFENGSEYHMVICGICNKVIVDDAPHIFGDKSKCIKCGFEKMTGSEGDCYHVYEYISNQNGTHVKTCAICGLSKEEECVYTAEGVCPYCGYGKPKHNHNFTYTSNNNGTHNRRCTSDCTDPEAANVENIACSYNEDNKCIYCGYMKQEADIKNGLHDGRYYKDDKLFTGTDGGYTFEYGNLVLTDSSDAIETDEWEYGWKYNRTFTMPNTESVWTNKVILRFPVPFEGWMPSYAVSNHISISADEYDVSSLKGLFAPNMTGAIGMLQTTIQEAYSLMASEDPEDLKQAEALLYGVAAADGENKKDGILAKIEAIYGVGQNYYPIALKGTFETYLNTAGEGGNKITPEQYSQGLAATHYIDYLKQNKSSYFLTTSSGELTFSGKYELFMNGKNLKNGQEFVYIAEPEFVLAFWQFTFEHVFWCGTAKSEPTNKYGELWQAISSNSSGISYNSEGWKSSVKSSYSMSEVYSAFDYQKDLLEKNKDFYFVVAVNEKTGNAWNTGVIGFEQNVEIVLNKKG